MHRHRARQCAVYGAHAAACGCRYRRSDRQFRHRNRAQAAMSLDARQGTTRPTTPCYELSRCQQFAARTLARGGHQAAEQDRFTPWSLLRSPGARRDSAERSHRTPRHGQGAEPCAIRRWQLAAQGMVRVMAGPMGSRNRVVWALPTKSVARVGFDAGAGCVSSEGPDPCGAPGNRRPFRESSRIVSLTLVQRAPQTSMAGHLKVPFSGFLLLRWVGVCSCFLSL